MLKDLLILTAPPAAGKTHLIGSLLQDLNQIPLVICPLRALADECQAKWQGQALVMTPEEWLVKKSKSKVIILDEFHLYFYWGDSFRPTMWEAFYQLVDEAELVLLLTATIPENMLREINNFSCHFDRMMWVNHGNQILKNHPLHYVRANCVSFISELIVTIPWKSGVSLIFCAYRCEVLNWERELTHRGYTVWTCLGGEASAFSRKVQRESPPDFIVATTVLSHGVNLPQITRIFFTYKVQNLDFWIQMVARGGRRGENFEVFALENPSGIRWNRLFNSLAILSLSLRMKWHKFYQQIEQWFLKESLSTKSPIKSAT